MLGDGMPKHWVNIVKSEPLNYKYGAIAGEYCWRGGLRLRDVADGRLHRRRYGLQLLRQHRWLQNYLFWRPWLYTYMFIYVVDTWVYIYVSGNRRWCTDGSAWLE